MSIQLLEYPIPAAPPAPAAPPSQKASSDDISGTKRGTIDPSGNKLASSKMRKLKSLQAEKLTN